MKKIIRNILIACVAVFVIMVGAVSCGSSGSASNMPVDSSVSQSDAVQSNADKQDVAEPEKELTLGQENALRKANEYLSAMAFSHDGLIEQLKYEGFTSKEAKFAADNCGADWNEQAAKKAEEYLDVMSFSRDSLIEQLEYEGFTAKQAKYGVKAVGY